MALSLLELAAKAAGYNIRVEENWLAGELPYMHMENERGRLWNPLTDDGDALRLMVKLRMVTNVCESDAMTTCFAEGMAQGQACDFMDDPYAATRRAIVLAAAEIGKGMP